MTTRALFIGSKRLGLEMLKALNQAAPVPFSSVLTIDDRNDERSVYDEFLAYCDAAGLDLIVCANKGMAKQAIVARRPDFCFISGWYWIFDRETLAAARHGFIGIHPSLLPKYRGGAPLVWQIIEGENEAGASLFYMGEGMDDGDVIAQFRTPIGERDHIADVAKNLERVLVAEIPPIWCQLLAGNAPRTTQDHSQATAFPMRRPDDGLIDWTKPAHRVFNFIRAQSPPYPGAFTIVGGDRIHCLDARVAGDQSREPPGTVLRADSTCAAVACGQGTVIEITSARRHGSPTPLDHAFAGAVVVTPSS